MIQDELNLEKFRKILAWEFVQKGVEPPNPGSKKEQQLYKQWLKGVKELKKIGHGTKTS